MTSPNKALLKAEEYSKHIPLSFSERPAGFVHSVFTNGLNIQMGKGLFFVGTDKDGQLPFGIHLKTTDVHMLVSMVSENDHVHWNKEAYSLTFPQHGITITLSKGRSFMNQLEQQPDKAETVIRHLDTVLTVLISNDEPTGLGLDIEQFMLDYVGEIQLENETTKRVYDLMEAAVSDDSRHIESTLRYFLGRGKGLTPSGDDHVVGLLAIHTITSVLSDAFIQGVKALVHHETITTDVGTEYLRYALRGEYSSAVVQIAQDLTLENPDKLEDHILNLLPMGHSSGVDTSFGMLVGILALRRTMNGR